MAYIADTWGPEDSCILWEFGGSTSPYSAQNLLRMTAEGEDCLTVSLGFRSFDLNSESSRVAT